MDPGSRSLCSLGRDDSGGGRRVFAVRRPTVAESM